MSRSTSPVSSNRTRRLSENNTPALYSPTVGGSPWTTVEAASTLDVATRVMSPSAQNRDNDQWHPDELASLGITRIPRERYVLSVPSSTFPPDYPVYTCEVCRLPCSGHIAMCGNCGRSGHSECLAFQFCGEYPFCGRCVMEIQQEYQRACEDQQQQLLWRA